MLCARVLLGLALVAGTVSAAPLTADPPEPEHLPPPPDPAPPPPPPIPRSFSATISPLHLPLPLLELTGEYRVQPKISAALILGVGRVSDTNGTAHGGAFEVGAQGSYYLMQSFRGLHVGVEVLYVHISDVTTDSSLTGAGVALGPFVGWKYIHRSGFTFVGQAGLDVGVVEASNASTSQKDRKVFPLLNLNVGWSL